VNRRKNRIEKRSKIIKDKGNLTIVGKRCKELIHYKSAKGKGEKSLISFSIHIHSFHLFINLLII
jgi:hypothetical protein